MARKSIGFKIGVLTFCLHLGLVVLASIAYTTSQSSTSGLAFIPFFFLDAPIHLLLLPLPDSVFHGRFSPLIIYGIFGSLMWYRRAGRSRRPLRSGVGM